LYNEGTNSCIPIESFFSFQCTNVVGAVMVMMVW